MMPNASQLGVTGIVFIGFFNTAPLCPWFHAAGITSLPSFRQHKLCSGQLNPNTWLGRTSAFAGGIPSLC